MIGLDFARKLKTDEMTAIDGYLLAMKAMMATLINLRRRGQFLGFSLSSLEKSIIWAGVRCGFVRDLKGLQY